VLNSNEIENLNVFISYSRPDQVFADELVSGLEFAGANVAIDRHSIREGEDWKARLSGLIAAADTIVFVLSPDSARSTICAWEVAEATKLGKRILPILWRPLDGAPPPPRLTQINYVRFDEGRSFMSGLRALITALATDLDWLRDHTQLLARAIDWERGGRIDNRLMSGNDIVEAKALVANRPHNAPEITPLQLDYIRASEEAENARNDALREQLEERSRLLKEAEAAAVQRAEALSKAETALKLTAQLRRRQDLGAALVILILCAVGVWAHGVISERRTIAREAARTDIRGQIVSFATSPGGAWDANEEYEAARYATAVARRLDLPNKSVVDALVAAHKVVNEASGSRQRPILSTSLNGFIYLARQPASRRKRAILVSIEDSSSAGNGGELPRHDVEAISAALQTAGFRSDEIIPLDNPDRAAIDAEIESAGHELASDDSDAIMKASQVNRSSSSPANTLLLLFYIGRGVELGGQNYIIPRVGKPGPHGIGIRDMISVQDLTDRFYELAAASVLIFDTNFPKASDPPKSASLSSY